jgi:hypothetical protein
VATAAVKCPFRDGGREARNPGEDFICVKWRISGVGLPASGLRFLSS